MTARTEVAAVIDIYRVVIVTTGTVTGLFLVQPPPTKRHRELNDWDVFSLDVTIWDQPGYSGRTYGYKDIWAHYRGDELEPEVSLHMTPPDRRPHVEHHLADVERAVHLAVVAYLERHSLEQVNADHDAWFASYNGKLAKGRP